LTNPAGCQRLDAGLWRAFAAAANCDAEAVARNAEAAQAALRTVPEPLLQIIALRIAEAANDNLGTLRAMAAAMRNAAIEDPVDESARFLLQARIAHLDGDTADEAIFLEHAARNDRTLPGLIAKTQLAELRSMEDGLAGAQSEVVLADIARIYRYEALGQSANEHLAERRLRQGDYAAALSIADETAGPDRARSTESRGAVLAARILRMLLVDPPLSNLPTPAERLALYWRYEGYATPGHRGDDIRLGAARTMLAEDLPAAALDELHGLSDTGVTSP
jgi:hypothetical protein